MVLPIGHHGRWLTDSLGRVVLLHGVNMVSKGLASPAARGFGDADAAWLAANGFDVVRLGLTAAALMPNPGVIDTTFLDSFTGTVHNLTSHGLLVLIDLHQDGWGPTVCLDGFPEWMTITHGAPNTGPNFPACYSVNPAVVAAFQSFWNNEAAPDGVGLQDHVATMFAALATAVGSDAGVLGYDLLNEPAPGPGASDCLFVPGGCPELEHLRLDPYYARMAAAIRAHDPVHLLFGEPYGTFAFGVQPTHIALPGGDSDAGLSFHMYAQSQGGELNVLAFAQSWAAETGGALLATEFGATPNPADIDRLVSRHDAALIPWIWWSYADNDGGGALIPHLGTTPGGANLYGAKADVLVRPHPVAVAGTPTSLTYDIATHEMNFTFTASGPDEYRYPAGTATVISVPHRTFPDGWHATISGGKVISSDDPSRLIVLADPTADSVTVVISPGPGAP
jgi:endoglycosylceramidase